MGRPFKWSNSQLAEAVSLSSHWSDLHRNLGTGSICGSTLTHLKNRCLNAGIDTSHFVKPSIAIKVSSSTKPASVILVNSPKLKSRTRRNQLLRALKERDVAYECVGCSNPGKWLDLNLRLEVDHVDGNWRNNSQDNLRLLCPNCHVVLGHSGRDESIRKNCCDCGTTISRKNLSRCKVCDGANRRGRHLKGNASESLKDIESLVNLHGWRGAGKILGISDNAVRKRYKRMGGDPSGMKRNYMLR